MRKKDKVPTWGYWVIGVFVSAILIFVVIGFGTISRRKQKEESERQAKIEEEQRLARIETNKAKAAELKAISDQKESILVISAFVYSFDPTFRFSTFVVWADSEEIRTAATMAIFMAN